MRDEDNNIDDNINVGAPTLSLQRAVPFGDVGNDNEVVDNNTHDDGNDNPTTVSEDNNIPIDEEAGNNNVNSNSRQNNNIMKPEIIGNDDAPLLPAQIAALYEDDIDCNKSHLKKSGIIDDDSEVIPNSAMKTPPLPPAQIAALYEQMVDDNDEKLMKKKLEAEQTTNQTHHVSEVTSSQSIQQLSQRISSTLSTSSGYHRQSTEEIIRRPPPPSMLIDPHFPSDEGGGVQIEDSAHSTLVLEATRISDPPVYHATPIQGWWKRNQKFLGLILVLIVGLAVMAALLASRNNGGDSSNGGDGIESILGNNATAEVSSIFSLRVILDQINCFRIVSNALLTCYTSINRLNQLRK